MIPIEALALLAVTVVAGCYLDGSLVLVPAQRRLSGRTYVEAEQANTVLGTIRYRVLLGIALLSQVVVLAAVHRLDSPLFVFTLASAVLLVATTVLITVRRVVPINRLVHTWSASRPPADWSVVRDRWHRLHYYRTGFVVIAMLLQATGTFIR